jgi:TPR repeat protein
MLTVNEFWGAFQTPGLEIAANVDEIIKLHSLVDSDKDGQVLFSEFLTLVLDLRRVLPSVCAGAMHVGSHEWCALLDCWTGRTIYLNKWTGQCSSAMPAGFKPPELGAQHYKRLIVALIQRPDRERTQEWATALSTAQHHLGRCHSVGKGVLLNLMTAAEWYLSSARMGSLESAHQLGGCFMGGWGVPIDARQSVYWYRAAAMHGHRASLAALRDPPAAAVLEWLQQAEAAEARHNLHTGRGAVSDVELQQRITNQAIGLGAVSDCEVQERLENAAAGWGEGCNTELAYYVEIVIAGDTSAVRALCKNPLDTAIASSIFNNPHALGYRGLMTTHVQAPARQPETLLMPSPTSSAAAAAAATGSTRTNTRRRVPYKQNRHYPQASHRLNFSTPAYVPHKLKGGRENLAAVASRHGHVALSGFLSQAIAEFHAKERGLKMKESEAELHARRMRQNEVIRQSRLKPIIHR